MFCTLILTLPSNERTKMPGAHVVDHALAHHHLSVVRSQATTPWEFRHSLTQLSTLVAIQATQALPLQDCEVTTPITTTKCQRLAKRIGLVPILRAGVIMVDPVLQMIPQAEVWHLGLYRDEETAQPVPYYNKLPEGKPVDIALILDPMLATGGSACLACESMQQWGAKKTVLVSVLAAPEGVAKVNEQFPDTDVYACAVDEQLNAQKFIVPGLGDAGDRVFNTQ